MSKYANIVNYFRQCPELKQLLGIAGIEERVNCVILPQGASPAVQFSDKTDVYGNYEATIEPYATVYEDFQINCYKWYDANDTSRPDGNVNVLSYDEVQSVCDWVRKQNNNNNFPDIGEKVVSIDCEPFVPQIQYVNSQEEIVAYFITVRVRYVNPLKKKVVEYVLED